MSPNTCTDLAAGSPELALLGVVLLQVPLIGPGLLVAGRRVVIRGGKPDDVQFLDAPRPVDRFGVRDTVDD